MCIHLTSKMTASFAPHFSSQFATRQIYNLPYYFHCPQHVPNYTKYPALLSPSAPIVSEERQRSRLTTQEMDDNRLEEANEDAAVFDKFIAEIIPHFSHLDPYEFMVKITAIHLHQDPIYNELHSLGQEGINQQPQFLLSIYNGVNHEKILVYFEVRQRHGIIVDKVLYYNKLLTENDDTLRRMANVLILYLSCCIAAPCIQYFPLDQELPIFLKNKLLFSTEVLWSGDGYQNMKITSYNNFECKKELLLHFDTLFRKIIEHKKRISS